MWEISTLRNDKSQVPCLSSSTVLGEHNLCTNRDVSRRVVIILEMILVSIDVTFDI